MTDTTEWSMHEITRAAGTTSRTLRHYDEIGLLPPARIGTNGYRYYDADGLVRLQRILLLRELGLSLAAIADVLAGDQSEAEALRTHLDLLEIERGRLERRITSVRTTLTTREGGGPLMATEMFDGFDHTRYEQEVTERWGRDAWQRSDTWWRSLTTDRKAEFQAEQQRIAAGLVAAYKAGTDAGSADVAELCRRHHDWLAQSVGTVSKEYYLGLADMYVADQRFATNYGGPDGARYVREAMRAYADTATFVR
ncbi:MerR family transcriptional regulator [Ruania suaedae]|uniref:MerR family transcriptional regulator n=1 Tax=Ruania suaedae TaxID=2897774 RepID=UPI001E4CA954|nr:MerR family transcriptional regulator [Ruania suaedae]UFU02931.1 MerR family transcriptional regulator [Ruania suaedae]